MKKWFILLCSLLALLACTRELEVEDTPERVTPASVEGKKVTITFDLPGFGPATRSLDEGGVLNSLRLAVFGGSGYLKEYVEATPVRTSDYSYETTDYEGNPVIRTVPCYTYTVTLALSDSPRTVHFLGNGPSVLPFGYDTAVMPVQLSSDGEMGYWQVLSLPDGIKAKRNAEGEFINAKGEVIPDGGTGYIADDDTERAFQGIPLIRNWSKIVLEADEDSNFTPVSLAVVNVPARGAMAPYSASTGFISEYESRSFIWLEDTVQYPGNLPVGTSFDDTIPDKDAFLGPSFGEGVADANGGAVYLYERPAPSSRIPATYVLIYGHYANPSDPDHEGDYFYKVDLMETKKTGESTWVSRYYPIYRNFKYKIVVKKIMSQGHATPAAAAASAGSADVSADISTGHLSDISDGVGRLHITPWMSQTFTHEYDAEHPVEVLHAFFSKSADGNPDMSASSVTVELLPPEDGGSDILYDLSIGAPSEESDSRGWRTIHFCSVAPGRTVRSQTIRITGTHDYGRLYRDVQISIQPIQPLKVTCDQPKIAAKKGTPETVTVSIPDGLVESMFPLEFTIEAEGHTLTPDGSVADNNLPVVFGTSISETDGYAGKQSFQYVRTLSWADYLGLPRSEDEEEQVWRSFTCAFLTNCDVSATRVWVYNEFFNKGSDAFLNIYDKVFQNLGFTIPIPQMSDVEIPLHFEMVEDSFGTYPDDYPAITFTPRGLRLSGDGITPGDDPGTYVYKPTSHSVDLTFISTTSYTEEIEVTLSAEGYETYTLVPHRFNRYYIDKDHPLSSMPSYAKTWGFLEGINNSNAFLGMVNSGYASFNNTIQNSKNIYFGYYSDPDAINPPVTLYEVGHARTLKVNTNSSNLVVDSGVTFPYSPGPKSSSGVKNYHEILLKSRSDVYDKPVAFILSASGYVEELFEAERFFGRIHTNEIRADALVNFNVSTGLTNYHSTDYGYLVLTIEPLDGAPPVVVQKSGTKGLYLGRDASGNSVGGTYRITQHTGGYGSFPQQMLMTLNLQIGYNYRPESATPADGLFYLYPGSNDRYIWHMTSEGVQESTMDLVVSPNRPVLITNIIFKSYSSTPKK